MGNRIAQDEAIELPPNTKPALEDRNLFFGNNSYKRPEQFRNYESAARSSVGELYRLNHANQTLDFVLAKKNHYLSMDKCEMGIWEAIELLNTLVDDSDPDISLPQIEHSLQT